MMIAARLAGGNLFLLFWVGGGISWSTRSTQIFFEGIFGWGIFGALGAARSTLIFLRGFVVGGFFFWGVGGVLDCKCWKKLKND